MEPRPLLLAALFCLLLCCIAGVAHGATHEMNPTTDLTALVAAITASADTDHVVHVASGTFPHRGQRLIFGRNYTQEFTCFGCANKTISFVGRLPAAAVSGKISFNISQANNISFSDLIFVAHGEQRQPFAIAEAQRLTLDRVSVFKYNTIASVLTARAVREVAIRNCYLDSLIASLSVIEVVQAERVVVDQLYVYASIYAVGLSLRNVTGDIAIANATFLYTSGLQLALFFCDSAVVTVVDSAFLLGTATVLGGVINAEQVFALNIIDTVFLYNQAPTASVLYTQDVDLAITRCKFLANGNEASLGTVLMIVDQGRLTIIDSDISINWGGMLLLLRLKAGSRIDSTTLDVNFNSPVSSMVTVNNCADTLTITNSSISHNLGGALRVAGCHAEMRNSMVWGQSTFGAICGALASIDATTSSIFRNGYKRENFANRYRDALCGGCLGFSIASDPNICTNAINITDIGGLDMCSRCDAAGAPLECGDCNGKPFGLATTEECTALNKLAVSGADASFNFTSPNCLLQPKDGQGAIFPGASLELRYEAVKVYYVNTTSQQEQAQFVITVNDTQYLRSQPKALCVRYDRLIDNGASFVLQQCLYGAQAEVVFDQQVLTIPKNYQKVTLNLAGLQSFDNQTREWPELDVATRRVEVEISLRLSQAATTRRSSSQPSPLADNAVAPGGAAVDSVSFDAANFSLSLAVPNFAVFSSRNGSAFNYTLAPLPDDPRGYLLVLKFAGTFDLVNYDPHFGMLLPGRGGEDGESDDILVKVLVPVLVGVAVLLVVVVVVAAIAVAVWKRRQMASPGGVVNFASSDVELEEAQ
ncbi:uncharacterized protein ACA1_052480 [Acanthamoeba castellanii str. Neff]|uniref:Uncharacterized protein n=1 Tax=Acanthamoeba castellanii (strain ATCC 30010 / Neff) TaxID=1257118 RepID=L8H5R0_ACACF|nr:uncharacterized protein ACA1_052480 [Acanthamoeba castellanii str. Neff]ELR20557.1 hypothetical protein ACA1_052480 [Acanthamoeba castellanii str. Neff]